MFSMATTKPLHGTLALLALAMLGACTSLRLPAIAPGQDTEASVRTKLGQPSAQWRDAGGAYTWEYSGQPYSNWNYLISFDAQGKVTRNLQALSDENIARLSLGMSREEVARLLGTPRTKEWGGFKYEHIWTWNAGVATATIEEQRFDVYFIADKVVRTGWRTVEPNECSLYPLCDDN